MAEQAIHEKFWDCVVSIAADDGKLRRVLSGILMLEVDSSPEDYYDMNEHMFHRYGITDPEKLDGVFELCEDRLLEEYVGNGN